ncbi:putative xyloglucan 6-xylosyltransferase [Helianthus annuus]|nr:putative xyloglucan 6-xylosyltransferase [Helianthus annuus]
MLKLFVDEEDDVKKDPNVSYSIGPKISDWDEQRGEWIHGIEIFYNMALLDAEMAGFWAKLPLIRKLLLSRPEVEFLLSDSFSKPFGS